MKLHPLLAMNPQSITQIGVKDMESAEFSLYSRVDSNIPDFERVQKGVKLDDLSDEIALQVMSYDSIAADVVCEILFEELAAAVFDKAQNAWKLPTGIAIQVVTEVPVTD